MNDPIERQDAIEAINRCMDIYINNLQTMIYKADAYKSLTDLPSAQSERKKGHWKEDWLASTSGGAYQVWRCSECESAFNWRMKYCGHCGAKMDEVDR